MQLSGQYMLLQHHGLKGPEVVSLSSAIAVNYSLTHLDLCDNRCVVVPVNDKVATFSSLFVLMLRMCCVVISWVEAMIDFGSALHSVMDEGAEALANAFTFNSTIKTLILSSGHIGWQVFFVLQLQLT